jgi:hypothetical protein
LKILNFAEKLAPTFFKSAGGDYFGKSALLCASMRFKNF